MTVESNTLIISKSAMQSTFEGILLKNGLNENKAKTCAEIFTINSLDGIYTHGVNRFPRFIKYLKACPTKFNDKNCVNAKLLRLLLTEYFLIWHIDYALLIFAV